MLAAGLSLPALQAMYAAPAAAAGAAVSLGSDSATLDTFQFVDDQQQADSDASGDDFLTFGEHRGPKKSNGLEGTAAGFVSEAASVETPGQPPFPLSPLNDLAVTGISTSNATATGNGKAVPVADADGSFQASIDTTAPVPVFFSGFIQATNTDPNDSCASVTVDLTGGTFSRHFKAFKGDCPDSGPRQKGWAESFTLPGGVEYGLDVEYSSEVDDVVPGEPKSVSESASVSLNLSFFPPSAGFTETLSGSVAHFNGSGSAAASTRGPIKKWKWTFGDGKTATTSAPKVNHTYPKSPRGPGTYTVTLQVIDSGGGVSPTARHTINGTAVSIGVKKKPTKLNVSATVKPRRAGHFVTVTLSREHGGKFRAVDSRHKTLSRQSKLHLTFPRPTGGRCRVTTKYAGDSTHLASQKSKTFAC